MAGEIGAINDKNPFWMKVKQMDDDVKPQGQSAGAYMACNDIGNFLNGTKAYS